MVKQRTGNESTNIASIVASRSYTSVSGGTCQYVVVIVVWPSTRTKQRRHISELTHKATTPASLEASPKPDHTHTYTRSSTERLQRETSSSRLEVSRRLKLLN